jgi:hypothetical protein
MVMDLEPNEGTKNILEFDSADFIFTPFVFVDVPEAYILEYFQIFFGMKMIYCLSSCHVNEIKSVQTP